MNKWSIIMPVYLGSYYGCGSNSKKKFERAVNSFLRQDYENKELVIIADGCLEATTVWQQNWSAIDCILFLKIPKYPERAGITRNHGLQIASGSRIGYLDADDMLAKNHLSNLEEQFTDDVDWVWFEDCIATRIGGIDEYECKVRPGVCLQRCKIGLGCIAHRSGLDLVWGDTYGNDWDLIHDLMKYKTKKVIGRTYIVCHLQYHGKSILDL